MSVGKFDYARDIASILLDSTISGNFVKLIDLVPKIVNESILKRYGNNEKEATDKIKMVSHHLEQAGLIINQINDDLNEKKKRMDELAISIESKQNDAKYWSDIASINKEAADAITYQIQNGLRAELEKGKTKRIIWKLIEITSTLIIGAVLGVVAQYLFL